MDRVTISQKYQIVIPKSVREHMNLRPGTSLEVIAYGSRLELVPVESIERLRGFLPGIDTAVEREDDRL